MTTPTFRPWPKTPRLFRDIIVTEKIDGTNAGIHIVPVEGTVPEVVDMVAQAAARGEKMQIAWGPDNQAYQVAAQSRNRMIYSGKTTDNAGFAAWVEEHATDLVELLGSGLHFGEWWGSGIQRGYGLPKGEKRFSLFNVDRYAWLNVDNMDEDHPDMIFGLRGNAIGLHVVPTLYAGDFNTRAIDIVLGDLDLDGSMAAPGFMRPEGIIVYHTAAQHGFKVLLENDDLPKGQA